VGRVAAQQQSSSAAAAPKVLRIAQIWRGTMLSERTLDPPEAVTLDVGNPKATFTIPADSQLPEMFPLLSPTSRGWVLTIAPGMGGKLVLDGRERSTSEFRESATMDTRSGGFKATPLNEGDWGILSLDSACEHAFFFQFVEQKRLPPQRADFDALLGHSMIFALVLCAAILILGRVGDDGDDEDDDFTDQDKLVSFIVNLPPKTEPPPVEEPEKAQVGPAAKGDPRTDGDPKKVHVTHGAAGKAGGQGDLRGPEGQKVPDPGTREVSAEVQRAGFVKEFNSPSVGVRKIFDKTLDSNMFAAAGRMSLQFGNGGGDRGSGRGKGTGVGPGEGTGTDTKSGGFGPGGGGKSIGDVVSNGEIDTGGGRAARGIATGKDGGKGLSERQVTAGGKADTSGAGFLSPEQIQAAINKRRGAFRACYDIGLKRSPNLGGKIVISWRIQMDGLVNGGSVRKKSTSVNNTDIKSYFVKAVKDLKFPQPDGGEVVVNYPFLLVPPN